MANATNIRVADYRDGAVYHAFTALSSDAWTAIAGYGYNSQNWVTAIKFQVAAPASSVTFAWYAWNSEGGFRDLKYKITEGESSSYINATSSTAGDGTFTAESGQYSQTTFTASKSLKANTDYVLYIWTNRSTSYNSFTSIRVWNASTYPLTVTYTAAASYKLTLSVGSNVTASVTLNSSPFGRSGSVANNGTIYAGEVLLLTYSVTSGYAIATHTLNGSTVNSGATHTVAGAVTIVLTAAASLSAISTGNGTFGTAQTITVTRHNSAYTHTITASCAGQSQTIATKSSSTSISWNPAVSIMNSITNAMSASCTLTCTTYNGNTSLGSTTIAVTLSLPTSGTYSVTPTPSVTITDQTGYATTYGGFIQGYSKASVNVTDGLKYSATTASRSTTANGTTYTASHFVTGILTQSGTNTFTATVKDSRGQTGAGSSFINVLAYTAPSISSFGVHRTDSSGTADDSGAYFVASYSVAITALNNNNTRSLTMRYKKASASTWTEVTITLSAYTQSGNTTPVAIDTGASYDVQLVLTDAFATTTKSTKLSTIPVTLDFNDAGTGIGVGKVSEVAGLFDVAWSGRFRNTIRIDGELTLAQRSAAAAATLTGGGSLSNADLDADTLFTGIYWCRSANSVTNIPNNYGNGFLIAISNNATDSTGVQFFVPFSNSTIPRLYVRLYINSQWYPWKYATLT